MKLSAATVAAIYKERWQIELFFKWVEQNLKIKSFIGTSENAVMMQIWVVLCAYLILAFIKRRSKLGKSLRLLQMNMFEALITVCFLY
ncbi:MAG: putative transposase [Arenicella sp.]